MFYCIVYFIEWKEILNASSAATLFRRNLLREQELEKPIRFSMDIESDNEDRSDWVHCLTGGRWRHAQHQARPPGCSTSTMRQNRHRIKLILSLDSNWHLRLNWRYSLVVCYLRCDWRWFRRHTGVNHTGSGCHGIWGNTSWCGS